MFSKGMSLKCATQGCYIELMKVVKKYSMLNVQ